MSDLDYETMRLMQLKIEQNELGPQVTKRANVIKTQEDYLQQMSPDQQ